MSVRRRTFLGRAGAVLALLFVAGPRKLYVALRTPTLTAALADGEWHQVELIYDAAGLEMVLVDLQSVRWRSDEQPPGGVALKERWRFKAAAERYVWSAGEWRDENDLYRMRPTQDGQTNSLPPGVELVIV